MLVTYESCRHILSVKTRGRYVVHVHNMYIYYIFIDYQSEFEVIPEGWVVWS